MSGRLLIYGAGGYTGRLLADHARALGLEAVLAGRAAPSVTPVAHLTGYPVRIFALDDKPAMDSALHGIDVVLHAAGPFAVTARPMAEACLRAGAHYLDVSGELPSFHTVHELDSAARAAGRMLMPGVGFAVAATDCLAAHVAARMPDATHLRIGLSATSLVSRGTYASMLGLIRPSVTIRAGGQLSRVPVGAREHCFDYGAGERVSTALSWADVFTAAFSTGIPNIEVYQEATAWRRWGYELAANCAVALHVPGVQALLDRTALLWPEGPSAAERAAHPRVIVAEASDRDQLARRARLFTPDGYSFTQFAALEIAVRVLAGDFRPGFQTPATVFGADFPLSLPGVRREDD